MAETGEELVKAIQRDLACPQCEYNLRGLYGAIVSCPECGATCDVAKLVSLRWTKPWYRAPGLGTVSLPAAWSVLGLIALPFAVTLDVSGRAGGLLAWLGVWLWLLWRAWRLFEGAEGVFLALANHALLAGYLLGVGGFIILVVRTIVTFVVPTIGHDPLQLFGSVCVLALLVLLAWACRRAERFVAQRCIRRYLARSGRT